jgi:hypothetical protein
MAGFLCLCLLGCGNQDALLLPDPAVTSGTVGQITGTILSAGVPQGSVNLKTVPVSATTVSDAAGNYTLAAVPPGTVTVVAEKAGFIRKFQETLVLAERTSRVDLVLFPATGAGTLMGEITDGQFGLDLVEVVTIPATQTRITTSDGRYQVQGTPGQYRVTARRLGYSTQSRVVQVLEGQTATQNFAMGPRNDGVLAGVVTDRLGGTLQNAKVDLFFGGEAFTAFTDAGGNYSFLNLTTGFYVLSSEAAGFLPGSKSLDIMGGTVANGDLIMALNSTLPPIPGAVTGTIYDYSGAPVEGITVTLSVAATPGSVLTLADGRFTFVDVPAGPVTVSATQLIPPLGGPTLANGTRATSVGAAQTADGSMILEEQ